MLINQLPRAAKSGGFTLIELLVVIGIILVLAGIGLTVGQSVIAGGQNAATADTIRLLENASYDFAEETGAQPSSLVDVASETPSDSDTSIWPMADAADEDGRLTANPGDVIPATALLLLDMKLRSPGSYDLISGIDPALSGSAVLDADGSRVQLPTIFDPFGNAIRFVHPAFDGGYGEFWDGETIDSLMSTSRDPRALSGIGTGSESMDLRRSYRPERDGEKKGDADEGICRNDRPYFYSAGRDGDAGTLIDNVYSDDARPEFPYETFSEQVMFKEAGRNLPGAS